jgi:class 3 adenylate cyclase
VKTMELPETRYVTVGGAQVAYQVVGDGPQDLAWCYAMGGQVDLFWEVPSGADLLRRLLGNCKVIVFDRRGSGASDAVPATAIPTWEELAEDLVAVLDAAGSKRTALMAWVESGAIAALFAAMHPERVSHLIIINTTARYLEADDYDIGVSPAAADALAELLAASWGTDDFTRLALPSLADDAAAVALWSRMFRASATPRAAAAQYEYFMRHVDIRPFLSLVQVPTLIFHAVETPLIPVSHARYLAAHIPGATLIEWPGADLGPTAEVPTAAADIIEFLTGERPIEIDRVLATVLFTDIVGSTALAASIGDRRWRTLLDAHDRLVREQVRRFKGAEVGTTGDGFLLSFDGPARAIRCAQAINQAIVQHGLELRMGLHTGECEVRGENLGGLAVHIAARVCALAGSQEILVSSTLKDLVVGSGIEFIEHGEHELKGVPGSWKLFAVKG